MMAFASRRRIQLGLVCLCAFLAWKLEAELTDGSMGATAASPPRAVALAPLAPPATYSMPPPEHYQAVLARPVFEPSRRPPATSAEAVATSPAAMPILSGIVGSGESRVALLSLDGETVRLRAGDDSAGWTVLSVGADAVVLQRGERRILLELSWSSEATAALSEDAAPTVPAQPPPFR